MIAKKKILFNVDKEKEHQAILYAVKNTKTAVIVLQNAMTMCPQTKVLGRYIPWTMRPTPERCVPDRYVPWKRKLRLPNPAHDGPFLSQNNGHATP